MEEVVEVWNRREEGQQFVVLVGMEGLSNFLVRSEFSAVEDSCILGVVGWCHLLVSSSILFRRLVCPL